MSAQAPSSRILAFVLWAALNLGIISPMLVPVAAFASHSECSDGVDNDGDLLVDYPQDPQCASLDDNAEGPGAHAVFVSITDSKSTIVAGDTMIYVITVIQERAELDNVDVVMHVPAEVDVLSVNAAGQIQGSDIVWHPVTLQYGIPVKLVIQARVKTTTLDGRLVVARVVTDAAIATDTTQVVAERTLPINPLFTLSLSDGKDVAQTQDHLTYILKAENLTNNEIVTRVLVTVPNSLSLETSTPAGAQFIENLKLQWDAVHFQPHESKTFRIQTSVKHRLQDYLPIFVRAIVGNVSVSDQTSVKTGVPDHSLAVALSTDQSEIAAGGTVTYHIHVSNAADQSEPYAAVHASIPLYTEFVSATEGASWNGRTVVWQPLLVTANGSRDLAYTVRASANAPLGKSLRAEVETDGMKDNVSTTVIDAEHAPSKHARASVSTGLISKYSDRSEVLPGGQIHFTIRVYNALLQPIHNAVVTDTFDPQTLSIADAGGADVTDGQLKWSLPVLAPGASWEVSYTAQVSAYASNGSSIGGIARLAGDGLKGSSLGQLVTVLQARVLDSMPPTGAPMDAITCIALLCASLGLAVVQRKAGNFA